MGISLSILLPRRNGQSLPSAAHEDSPALSESMPRSSSQSLSSVAHDTPTGQPPVERKYEEGANKFWTLYVNEAEQDDKYITETWKSDMDSTLIFAGLFSAAVTAFLIDSYKLLNVDSSDVTNNLLEQMLAIQIVGASLNTSAIPLPTAVPTLAFTPSASAITINVLWFLSLSCSLAAALCATLVQQWTRDYLQRIHQSNQPQRRGTIRAIMFLGSRKWRINDVVDNIPSLLHLSLFSFFAGLCTFLWTIDSVTAGVVLVIVIGCLGFYMFATFAPVWDPSAPYETPLSALLWKIRHHLTLILDHVKQKDSDDAHEASALSPVDTSIQGMDLVKAREALALPPVNLSIHQHIQVVSWLYDRTTDDTELEKLVAAIPGFLDTEDGQKAWEVFFTNTPETAKWVEDRIVGLFETCTGSAHSYLDQERRKLRATLCINALLAMSSVPQFSNTRESLHLAGWAGGSFIKDSLLTLWKNDDILATMSVCLEAIFRSRSLSSELELPPDDDFHNLSTQADQVLRDIDDMQHIIDNLLQEYDGFEGHKADIVILATAYFDVLDDKFSNWTETTLDTIPHIVFRWHAFLSWYYIPYFYPSRKLSSDYDHDSHFSGKHSVSSALQMPAYLRLHKVFPPLPEISYTLNENARGLSEAWLEYLLGSTDELCPRTDEGGFPARETGIHMPIVHHEGSFLQYWARELQPLSSLLGIAEVSPPTIPTRFNLRYETSHRSCNWIFLITQEEGPFSLLASLIDAYADDKGKIGGLLMLVMVLQEHNHDLTRAFDSSIVHNKWLEAICPYLSHSWEFDDKPLNRGSQFLLVITLLEVLAWKRDTAFEVRFPISDNMIKQLLFLLRYHLNEDQPIRIAERALGITPDSGNESHNRVMLIDDRMVELFREAGLSKW